MNAHSFVNAHIYSVVMRTAGFALLISVLSITAPVPAFAGDELLEQWFEAGRHAEQYHDVRGELQALFARESIDDLPGELILRFLREAAVKRVPAERLVPAVEEYLERLAAAQRAIEEASDTFLIESDVTATVEAAVVFLQTSATADSLRALLEYASSGRHAREAFFTLSELYGIDDLTSEQLTELGRSILESNLSAGSYGSVASLYVQSRARQNSASRVIRTIVDTLDDGGGLVQLRQALR